MRLRIFVCVVLLSFVTVVAGQSPRIDPAGIDGALLLCGSYKASPEMFEKFVELAGGAKEKIVIVTFDKAQWGAPPRDELQNAAKKLEAAMPIVIDYAGAVKAFPAATGLWLHIDSVKPMPDGKFAE